MKTELEIRLIKSWSFDAEYHDPDQEEEGRVELNWNFLTTHPMIMSDGSACISTNKRLVAYCLECDALMGDVRKEEGGRA